MRQEILQDHYDLVFNNPHLLKMIFLFLQNEQDIKSSLLPTFLLVNKLFYKTQQETWQQFFYSDFPDILPNSEITEEDHPLSTRYIQKINSNWREQYSLIKTTRNTANQNNVLFYPPMEDQRKLLLVKNIYYGYWKKLDENKADNDTIQLTLSNLAKCLPKPFNNKLFFQSFSIYLDYKAIEEKDFFCEDFRDIIRIIEKSENPTEFFYTLLIKYGKNLLTIQPTENNQTILGNDLTKMGNQNRLLSALNIFSNKNLAKFLNTLSDLKHKNQNNNVEDDNWLDLLFHAFSSHSSYRDRAIQFLSNFADSAVLANFGLASHNDLKHSNKLNNLYSSESMARLIENGQFKDYQLNLLGRGSFKLKSLFLSNEKIISEIKRLIDQHGIEKIIQSRDPFANEKDCYDFKSLLLTIQYSNNIATLPNNTAEDLQLFFHTCYLVRPDKKRKLSDININSGNNTDTEQSHSDPDEAPELKKRKLNEDNSESNCETEDSIGTMRLG